MADGKQVKVGLYDGGSKAEQVRALFDAVRALAATVEAPLTVKREAWISENK